MEGEEASLEEVVQSLQAQSVDQILKILVIKYAKRSQHQLSLIVRQARQSLKQMNLKTLHQCRIAISLALDLL